MKRKMMLSLFAAAGAALMSVSAFAGETAEDVLSKYSAASKELTEFKSDVDINADIDINIPDMDMAMGINVEGDMNVACIMDPIAVATTGSFSLNMMGQAMDMEMNMYAVTEEDGSLGSYVNMVQDGESTGWQYTGVAADEASALTEMAKNMNVDFSQLPFEFDLTDGTVDVDGYDCYQLTTSLTGEDIIALVQFAAEAVTDAASEAAGEEVEAIPTDELSEIAPMLDGLLLNVELDIESSTYYPIRMHLDMDGSDWTILSAVFAQFSGMTNDDGSLMNVELDVPTLYIDYLYNYDEDVEIVVPEEALAAKAEGTTMELDDLGELAGDLG